MPVYEFVSVITIPGCNLFLPFLCSSKKVVRQGNWEGRWGVGMGAGFLYARLHPVLREWGLMARKGGGGLWEVYEWVCFLTSPSIWIGWGQGLQPHAHTQNHGKSPPPPCALWGRVPRNWENSTSLAQFGKVKLIFFTQNVI